MKKIVRTYETTAGEILERLKKYPPGTKLTLEMIREIMGEKHVS